MREFNLCTPLTDCDIKRLGAGDKVFVNGKIYTARDAAHKRFYDLLIDHQELPVDLKGQVLYYVGPTPARPGCCVGSAGPTTSSRMDKYTPPLIAEKGVKALIGKGSRSLQVKQALQRHTAVYLAAGGGAGALLARCITSSRVVAYPELGPEAVYELVVENFPVIVVNDCYGRDLYEEGRKQYAAIKN